MPTTIATDFTDTIAARQERDGHTSITRDEAIRAIRAGLKRRTGRAWSVTGGRGTAYGWLRIDAPKARRTALYVASDERDPMTGRPVNVLTDTGTPQPYGLMTAADCAALGQALGFDAERDIRTMAQGISVASSTAHYVEFIARAEGRRPSAHGQQYWD